MVDRKRLADGVTDEILNRDAAEAFVFKQPRAVPPAAPAPAPAPTGAAGNRAPLTTRLRADLGAALKRASLERELAGNHPYQVQEILDEALEPWLRDRGYLA